jgi:hypothetical protein
MDPQLAATIAMVSGLFGAGGLATIVVALINKRPSPFDQLLAVFTLLQAQNTRMEAKLGEVHGMALEFRDYGLAWEEWHAAGMPDPPGKPPRPKFTLPQ